MSDNEPGWLRLPPLKPELNESWNLLTYMDVSATITNSMFRVGKQVEKETGNYRYFIEQGDLGEEGRTYGEWHYEPQ